jgi:HSA
MDDTPATTAQGLLQRKEDIERRLVDLLGDGQNDVSTSIIPVEEDTATTMPTKRVARKSARKTTHNEGKAKQGSTEDNANHPNASNPTTITTTTTTKIPFVPKTDTHWDFVMKEMMWLGADFQGERKRQVSLARKMALRYVPAVERGRDPSLRILFWYHPPLTLLPCYLSLPYSNL